MVNSSGFLHHLLLDLMLYRVSIILIIKWQAKVIHSPLRRSSTRWKVDNAGSDFVLILLRKTNAVKWPVLIQVPYVVSICGLKT